MPKTAPPKSAKKPRAKALTADHELASRVAAHLDVSTYQASEAIKNTVESVQVESEKVVEAVSETAKEATQQVKKAAAPVVDWFGEGFSRMANAIDTAQSLAHDSVKTFADSRTDAAQTAVALQKKLMLIAQSNVADGLEAARKLLSAANVNEAIAIQSEYARETAKTLSGQAKELQALSAKLAETAHKPLAAHWSRAAEAMKAKLH